jgi:hypothetical protein
MTELNVPERLVLETLRSPLVTQPGGSEHRNNAVVYTGREIRVVADPVTATVITVQLRTAIPYLHGVHTLDHLPQSERLTQLKGTRS